MRIGIYGGTFNPIHYGHLHIAQTALNILNLDYVIFIPASNPYMKNKNELESYFYRKEMISLATKDNEHFLVRDDDATYNEPSYMSNTILNMKKEFPNSELFLILGEDAYNQLISWHEPDTIIDNINGIFVYRRNSTEELRKLYPVLTISNTPEDEMNVSSTMIRRILKENPRMCRYLLHKEVYDYIIEHDLYGGKYGF